METPMEVTPFKGCSKPKFDTAIQTKTFHEELELTLSLVSGGR